MQNSLIIKTVRGNDRGVFANSSFSEGEVVIADPVVIFPQEQYKHIDKTALETYYFNMEEHNFIALGPASLVNHSDDPNCEPDYIKPDRILKLIAIKPISPGDEITIDYGWESYPWKKE